MAAWPTIPERAPVAQQGPTSDPEPDLSQQQLAKRRGVSVATIARARKKGRLIGSKVEGQWRFSKQQVADYQTLCQMPLRLYGKCQNDNDPLDAS